jgi:uncharacterized membrane protein
MRESMFVLSLWLHLLATVIWIGGIASVLFVVLPSAKAALGQETARLMGAVSKRFTPMANASIVLLVVTGTVLIYSGSQASGTANGNIWSFPFVLKLLLALIMILVHFYRNLILAPRIAGTSSEAQKGSLQRLSLNLVKANFFIGLAVLFLSGMVAVL